VIRERAQRLRLGMVGGGVDAFIGGVHRTAARLDGNYELEAGALSSTPERSRVSGEALGLSRIYDGYEAMVAAELALPASERIEAVSIVTPNYLHYPVAKAFLTAGVHVICDKPMTLTSLEADELVGLAERTNTVLAVTYNYTGYPMVRQARAMVDAGELGAIRKVVVEYHQGWLATKLEDEGVKQAAWRADPSRAGIAGAMGDIGSHAENLAATMTGLEVEAVCADVTRFVPGRALDDDASVLLRFGGGAKGVLMASQIAVGMENDLRIRVFGETGSLTWHQEDPNRLLHHPIDGPPRVFTRGGAGLAAAASAVQRIPAGHPEGFLEAFATLYSEIATSIRGRQEGGGARGDHPTGLEGARGMRFMEAVITNAELDEKWTSVVKGNVR